MKSSKFGWQVEGNDEKGSLQRPLGQLRGAGLLALGKDWRMRTSGGSKTQFGPHKREVMEAGTRVRLRVVDCLGGGFGDPRRPPVLKPAHAARDMGTEDLA